ncbi:MAG: NAD(+)/NADH kinase [Myxococcota bacterium]
MTLSRVLLVTKQSAYETYARDRRVGRAALSRARRTKVNALRESHDDHYKTLAEVEKALDRMNLRVDRIQRDKPFVDRNYDLILTVGGDGTFISASHHVRAVPVLGVNSAPRRSVGFFCSATRRTVARDLEMIQAGALPALSLARLQVELDRKAIAVPVLNDVLFSHELPAAMSRYEIRVGGAREEQKSSGVWIAAPAGGGAGTGSAGGRKLPLGSRKFQFVVREPYRHAGHPCRLRRGILGPGESLRIESHIGQGRIFIDGPHVSRAVPFGSLLRVGLSPHPLRVLGLRQALRKRAKKRPPGR